MPRVIVGQKFGRWEVLGPGEGRKMVLCRCDCGTVRGVISTNLTQAISTSCGCWKRQAATERTKHGHSKAGKRTRAYAIWAAMKSRCMNPKTEAYKKYGARGISVCDRWLTFENFLADMGEPPAGASIDRKNGSGNYEPGNCRWASAKEQARNISTNRIGYVSGRAMCVAEASERFGVKYRTIMSRMNRGLTMEQAVFYGTDLAKAGGLK